MNLLTVYNAYKDAERRKKDCVSSRGSRGHYGIAVNKDGWALEWQKRDRQARRLDRYLTQQLNLLKQARK